MKTSSKLLIIACAVVIGACAPTRRTRVEPLPAEEPYVRRQPGVVDYVWEEPMVDAVDVPPGLDPEGHYYRPAHQAVIEIRQGRYQYYKPE